MHLRNLVSLSVLGSVATAMIGLAATATGCSDGAGEAESHLGASDQASMLDPDAGGPPQPRTCEAVIERDLIAKANSVPPHAAAVEVLRHHLFRHSSDSYPIYRAQ